MRFKFAALAAVILMSAGLVPTLAQAQTPPSTATQTPLTPEQIKAEQAAEDRRLADIQASLHPQTGMIKLDKAKASLNLGDAYYFLGPDDAKKVLVQAWGNPPDQADGVLGLIFARGATVADNLYGAVVQYDDSGYVTDKDASQQDYDKLLADMKKADDADNAERAKKGFVSASLIGWAQPPTYDRSTHNLIWAREIAFGSEADHTVNYDVRHLGRNGVLSINFVSKMKDIGVLRPVAAALARTAEFDPGVRYADHQGGDKAAGYGLVGLVGAGVGLAVAQKVGLLGIVLLLVKKFAVLIIAAMAGAGAWVRRVLGLKPKAAKKPPIADFAGPDPSPPPTEPEEPPRQGDLVD